MIEEVLIQGVCGCLHIEPFRDNSYDLAIMIDSINSNKEMDRFTVLIPPKKCREIGKGLIAYADLCEALDVPEFER